MPMARQDVSKQYSAADKRDVPKPTQQPYRVPSQQFYFATDAPLKRKFKKQRKAIRTVGHGQ